MADGTQIDEMKRTGVTPRAFGYTLLDAAGAIDNGVWIDARLFNQASVEVQGTFVGTVQVYGSNAAAKPDNTAAGTPIGSPMTASGMLQVTPMPMRWIKASVTAWTSGAITAVLQGLQ